MKEVVIPSDAGLKAYKECKDQHWNISTWIRYFVMFHWECQRFGREIDRRRDLANGGRRVPLERLEERMILQAMIQLSGTLTRSSHQDNILMTIPDKYIVADYDTANENEDKEVYLQAIDLICKDFPLAVSYCDAILNLERMRVKLPICRRLFGRKLQQHEMSFFNIRRLYEEIVKFTALFKDPL